MENWIIYAGIAAILIAGSDLFTKKFSKKYSHMEHLLYYYVLCGFFIISLAIYKTQVKGEKIKIIDTEKRQKKKKSDDGKWVNAEGFNVHIKVWRVLSE